MKKSKAKEKLPEMLYVWRESDGDESYIMCSETLDGIADETKLVGVYTFSNMAKIDRRIEISPVKLTLA